MEEGAIRHSPELDGVRQLLFPKLAADEGWKQIDRALAGASDAERWARIEQIAADRQLDEDLLLELRKFRPAPSGSA